MKVCIKYAIDCRALTSQLPICRSSLEQLLKENYLTPGGEENIKCFFREEGYQTGISNVIKVHAPIAHSYDERYPLKLIMHGSGCLMARRVSCCSGVFTTSTWTRLLVLSQHCMQGQQLD